MRESSRLNDKGNLNLPASILMKPGLSRIKLSSVHFQATRQQEFRLSSTLVLARPELNQRARM